MESKTAHQVIERAYQDQPYLNLATTSQENVIGAWSNEHSRYAIVASLTLTGEWVSVPFELLINGAAPVREWVPVAKLVKPEALYFVGRRCWQCNRRIEQEFAPFCSETCEFEYNKVGL